MHGIVCRSRMRRQTHRLKSVVAFRQTAGTTGKMKNKLILEVSTMKIKSLFLGSAAAVALSSGAMAADPIGVALDTCSLLNITGLVVSSESNCLKFSGEVSYDWDWDIDAATTTSDFDWGIHNGSNCRQRLRSCQSCCNIG